MIGVVIEFFGSETIIKHLRGLAYCKKATWLTRQGDVFINITTTVRLFKFLVQVVSFL